MGLKDIRKKFFGTEELTVEHDETPEVFRERKLKEIESAENRAGELKARTSNLLEDLKSDLEEMKEYSDDEGLKVVDDVAEDFAHSQKLTVKKAEFSEDIEQHLEDLKDFVSEFNDVSEKQGQVMRRINNRTELLAVLEDINDHVSKINEFISSRYTVLRRYRRIKQLEEEISDINSDIEGKRARKEDISTVEDEEETEEVEERISELKDSREWAEFQEKRQKLEEMEDERQDIRNSISKNISTMRRGLKKLIYQVQNDEVEFEAEIDKLDKISEGEYVEAGSIQESLEEARKRIKQEELLEPRQIQNFVDASRELSDFRKMVGRRDDLEAEIRELEAVIDDSDVKEELKGLERDLRELEDRISKKRERQDNLKQEITRLKQEKEEKISEIEVEMNEGLDADVSMAGS